MTRQLTTPTPEQEHRVVEEVAELWRRYKLLRQHARNNGRIQNSKFHYRSCCRTILRQIRAVVRQTWPQLEQLSEEQRNYRMERTIVAQVAHNLSIGSPPKGFFEYKGGWTPPPYRPEDHEHVEIHTMSAEKAREYWEWLQRWTVGEVS